MASPSLHFADPASNLIGSFASFQGPKCRRRSFLRVIESSGSKKLEIVYDPVGRYEELTKELQSSGGFARNLTLFLPSKINDFLGITSKRPDGYHDLTSLFHVISLGDTLKFSVSPSKKKDSLTTNVFGIPLDDSNLVKLSIHLFLRIYKTFLEFQVVLALEVAVVMPPLLSRLQNR
ncbi:hypothetical protein SELMODRAFT_428850 [Selaginella moellendorffii]|uniref:Uncharacterized protein n=1 Tax=Selaginella moellendorffii TaxID=88036 RepID=D8T477_SELML|nr:hypothetical protein SELMODRAFT_428850 [Selaginella moellendorffii]